MHLVAEDVAPALVACAEARIGIDRALAPLLEARPARYKDLAAREAGTVQMAEQTVSRLHQDQAALRNAQSALVVAQRQVAAPQRVAP